MKNAGKRFSVLQDGFLYGAFHSITETADN